MYSRDYDGKTLNFEASGGLTNATLVMQDKQTDTYWSIMKGTALKGELKGNNLKLLPLGIKVTWKEWKTMHPNSKVLSSAGNEDGTLGNYKRYFEEKKGFRGLEATDKRLKTMDPIFAFLMQNDPTVEGENFAEEEGEEENTNGKQNVAFAIAYSSFESGLSVALSDGTHAFLYREKDDEIFRSTVALISEKGFEKSDTGWTELGTGNTFDAETRTFAKDLKPLIGFDTFWYNWSLDHPDTKLLTTTQ